MHPETALFYLLAGITLGSALLVVTTKSMVRAIFLFFVTLFAVAGLYIFSLADFVALTQVVIYAGGVLVLMLFAFMLSDKDMLNRTLVADASSAFGINKIAGLILASGFLFLLVTVISPMVDPSWVSAAAHPFGPADITITVAGISLMTRYLLPFEVVSVFLLMALIGAVHLSRKEQES